jgi:hypothetical protein
MGVRRTLRFRGLWGLNHEDIFPWLRYNKIMKNFRSLATHFGLTCTRWTSDRHQASLGWCLNRTLRSHVIKIKSLDTALLSRILTPTKDSFFALWAISLQPTIFNISVFRGWIYTVIRYVIVCVCTYVCIYTIVRYEYVQSCHSVSYYVLTQMATLYPKLCHLQYKIVTYFTVLTEDRAIWRRERWRLKICKNWLSQIFSGLT